MRKILNKIGSFSIGPMVVALLGLITVPVVTRIISPDEYGRASMFTLVQGLITMVLYLGLDQAYAREFVRTGKRQDQLLINAIVLPMGLSFIVAVILVVFNRSISNILFGSPNEQAAVYLMALMFPVMVVECFSFVKLRMEERGFMYSLFSICLKALTLVLTVLLLFLFEKSFRSVVYAMALAEIINGVILFCVVFRKIDRTSLKLDYEMIRSLLRYGLPLVPACAFSWILTSMDKVMLRSLCTYSELGLYSAASKIVSVLGIVQSCFTVLWVPVAFRWYDSKKDNTNFETVMQMIARLMGVMCFGILLCKDVLAWILGADFAQAIEIFPFLMLYPIMYTMSETTCIGISFSRKTEYNILISLVAGITNIGLNLLLIPVIGGKGAAVATGISYIVFFWLRTIISRKLWWNFPVSEFAVLTILISLNCLLHSFSSGIIPYVVSGCSLVLMVIFSIKPIKKLYLKIKYSGNEV